MLWKATFDCGRTERVLGVGPMQAAMRLVRKVCGDQAYPVACQLDRDGGVFQIVSRQGGKVLAVVDISREGANDRRKP